MGSKSSIEGSNPSLSATLKAMLIGILQASIGLSFSIYAPVAQLDRVPGYEPGGREFESLRARHLLTRNYFQAPLSGEIDSLLFQ